MTIHKSSSIVHMTYVISFNINIHKEVMPHHVRIIFIEITYNKSFSYVFLLKKIKQNLMGYDTELLVSPISNFSSSLLKMSLSVLSSG